MNHNINPLKNIPDIHVRHIVMQALAFMWCVAFSTYFTSIWLFGITTIAHIILLGAVFFTVLTFETANRKPKFFDPMFPRKYERKKARITPGRLFNFSF